MGPETVKVSVIVPTYNERDNIEELVARLSKALSEAGVTYEIVIVDDNSPDGTAELARSLSRNYPIKVVVRPGRLGLSSAVLEGMKVSRGEYLVVMDADLQHPPEVVPKLVEKAEEGYDMVIASRYIKGGGVEGWGVFRRVISLGASLIAKLLLPKARRIGDPMSGFFLVRREQVGSFSKYNPKGFKILLELLVKGDFKKVCEVPYVFKPRVRGKSKLGAAEILNYLIHVLNLMPDYLKFASVGALGTLVNLGTLALLRYVVGIHHYIASAVAIEVSVIHNFTLNDLWTFRESRVGNPLMRLLKFHLTSLTAILIQYVTSVITYTYLIRESIVAQLIGILLGYVVNYLASRTFVWRVGRGE